MEAPYLDTSALAKWYINEPKSEELETYIRSRGTVVVSRLTSVEFRCLLARRRRDRQISRPLEGQLFEAFEQDIREGFLSMKPWEDRHAAAVPGLIGKLPRHPLKSLDAMHLATASLLGCEELATADRVMARAAAELGFSVTRFD